MQRPVEKPTQAHPTVLTIGRTSSLAAQSLGGGLGSYFCPLSGPNLRLPRRWAGLARPAYSQAITQDVIVAPASQVRQLGAPMAKVIGCLPPRLSRASSWGSLVRPEVFTFTFRRVARLMAHGNKRLSPTRETLMSTRLVLLIPVTFTLV
jgi:hypothetical protein